MKAMIWSLSWKNIWRNKLRSSIVIAAITIGLFGGIFAAAVMVGMGEQRLHSAIHNEVSHIQIHHPKFSENQEMKYTIDDYGNIEDSIRELNGVKSVTSRINITAMARTANNATGVTVLGVNPEQEKTTTEICTKIPDGGGTYLDTNVHNAIFIGEELARDLNIVSFKLTQDVFDQLAEADIDNENITKLQSLRGKLFRKENRFDDSLRNKLGRKTYSEIESFVKETSIIYNLRKKIVLTFQSADGNLTGGAFRVTGVYDINNTAFERTHVFVRRNELQELTGLSGNKVHEMAVLLNDIETDNKVAAQISNLVPDLKVQLWKDLSPNLKVVTSMMDFFMFIFLIIILLALGFGIVNTMLMAVLERMKELGMLMAVGMNKKRVFSMIMLETIFLSMTGAIAGMIISYLLILYTGNVGMDLSSLYKQGFESLGYSAVLYPELGAKFFLEVTGLVILTAIIASLYPAKKALSLRPAEALRTE